MTTNEVDEFLFKKDFSHSFKEWLNLDLHSITWEGRFSREFNLFWERLFAPGLSLLQIKERFIFLVDVSRNGPIISWSKWLENRFIIYLFCNSNITIKEFSDMYGRDISKVAINLRDFLIENFPEKHSLIDENLQVSLRTQRFANLSLSEVLLQLGIEKKLVSESESIYKSLEVTLFKDWEIILKKMKNAFQIDQEKIKNQRKVQAKKKSLRFLLEFLGVLLVGFFLIYLVTVINKVYESYLLGKIDIYSPKIEWLDEDIKFSSAKLSSNAVDTIQKDIENIEDDAFPQKEFLEEGPRFEAESEVVLTSWDSLPQDIGTADQEVSEYEEERPGGFRDNRFGSRKVYRVIMESVQPAEVKVQIQELLDKYQVTKGDRVSPGTVVPGGVYYNLFVPREFLKEFLALVTKLEVSRIFESRTRRANPRGKNKVFIWIKKV